MQYRLLYSRDLILKSVVAPLPVVSIVKVLAAQWRTHIVDRNDALNPSLEP
jgi:hypothetical protein